jgi:serine/threonine protein kinase
LAESEHPYESVTELASGDFGTLSVGQGGGRVVFLRRFPTEAPWSSGQLDAAAAASRRAKPLHHPSLLAVVSVNRGGDGLAVTTEYVEGVPLSVLMKRAQQKGVKIPLLAALRIAEELARALIAAEELCVKHGEAWVFAGVHPECVIVSSGDDALISNVGLLGLTRPFGHPRLDAYRAPELVSGKELTSESAGVYSVGLMLWELLSGREAYAQSGPDATAKSVLDRALRGDVPRLGADVPALLVEIVMEAISVDPSERFPNMRAFSDALSAVQEKRRSGELVRFMNDLAADLLERQRGAIVRSNVAPASWRPTVHTMDAFTPQIPQAPRLIGLAAFQPTGTDAPTDSARSVDSLLGKDAEQEPMRVDVPASLPLGAARAPQATEPLLLVPKENAQPKPSSSPSVDSALALDAELEALQRPRRLGPLLIVLLVFGGAIAIGVLAFQRHLEQSAKDERPLPAPIGVASGSAESGTAGIANEESSPATSASAKAEPLWKKYEKNRPAHPRGGPSASASASAAPSASAPPAPASAEPTSTSDNPYVEKPAPAPTASASGGLGF